MFVLIFRSACYKAVSAFRHKHKKIVNFVYSHLRFSTTCITNKKAHDIIASVSRLSFCDTFEIVEIPSDKRKAKTLYVNMLKCFI